MELGVAVGSFMDADLGWYSLSFAVSDGTAETSVYSHSVLDWTNLRSSVSALSAPAAPVTALPQPRVAHSAEYKEFLGLHRLRAAALPHGASGLLSSTQVQASTDWWRTWKRVDINVNLNSDWDTLLLTTPLEIIGIRHSTDLDAPAALRIRASATQGSVVCDVAGVSFSASHEYTSTGPSEW